MLVELCDIVCKGVTPYAPALGKGGGAGLLSLVKFFEFLLDRGCFQRKKSVFHYCALPFFAVDEFDEFYDDRIQWFIGSLIDIEIEVSPERVGAVVGVLLVGLFKRRALFFCQW